MLLLDIDFTTDYAHATNTLCYGGNTFGVFDLISVNHISIYNLNKYVENETRKHKV